MVLQEERGYQLLQGLILHELGHHFAHFSDAHFHPVFARCRADRLLHMLNVIEDEHLERRLRALDPGWGEAFDALTSYAFKGQPIVLFIEQYRALLDIETNAEVTEALHDGLSVPLTPAAEEAQKKDLQAAANEAVDRIDRWLSGGMDLKEVDAERKPILQRGGIPQGVVKVTKAA